MSTADLTNAHFDDSEDEDDNFNPQPADLSDAEDAPGSDHDDDAGAQIRSETARRDVKDDGSDEGSTKGGASGEHHDEEDDEDAEGEGEDLNHGDEEEEDEDEEDDEEDEITVSANNIGIQLALRILFSSAIEDILIFSGSSQKAHTRTSKSILRY